VSSEITKYAHNSTPPKGWILYDAQCGLCTSAARRNATWLKGLGYGLAPLPGSDNAREMLLVTPDNRVFPGVDAYIHILAGLPHTAPLVKLTQRPRIHQFLCLFYRWVADHRGRISEVCRIKPRGVP